MSQIIDPFYALGDPNRRYLFQLLSEDTMTINALAENFEMSRPAVSKHIKILSMAGFIAIEDIGRERYCHLNREGFEDIKEWIGYFDDFWKLKLGKLENILKKKNQH